MLKAIIKQSLYLIATSICKEIEKEIRESKTNSNDADIRNKIGGLVYVLATALYND